MAVSLKERIDDLRRKVAHLERKYSRLIEDKSRLEARNEELQIENKRLRNELKAAETSAEFLTMSHLLASDPDNIIKARRKIESMIREIDRCISQLKE